MTTKMIEAIKMIIIIIGKVIGNIIKEMIEEMTEKMIEEIINEIINEIITIITEDKNTIEKIIKEKETMKVMITALIKAIETDIAGTTRDYKTTLVRWQKYVFQPE